MPNKRGMELSLNFIVILIISIIVFGFGVRFIYNLSSKATELQELTMSELDDRIGDIVCEGAERVCIAEDRKTIKRTKFYVFGIKIINIIDDTGFNVKVTPDPSDSSPKLLGYKKDNTEIKNPPSPLLIVNPQARSILIEKNEEKDIGIGVEVPAKAIPGTYILNVKIETTSGQYSMQKLYVDVP